MTRGIVALGLALLLAQAVFWLVPGLDLATAQLFYDGTSFPIADNRGVEALRITLYAAEDFAAVLTLILLITSLRYGAILNLTPRDWAYQLALFVLGPGVLVNLILKRQWGRARPFRITEFGGSAQFSAPWQISDQCSANCSFVSGEMAGATALAICLLLILHANRRRISTTSLRLGQIAALSMPAITGWQRMAAGKHFLSDVVFAFLLICLLATILRLLFYPAKALASAVDIPRDSP